MKTYYVTERVLVSVEHIVNAKSKKHAIEQVKNWEIIKSEIAEYLWTDWIDVIDVWLYEDK